MSVLARMLSCALMAVAMDAQAGVYAVAPAVALATSPAVAPAMEAAAVPPTIPAADAHVARTGRSVVAADGAVRFGYPGVGFRLRFHGTRLALTASADGANSYFDVIVDGGAARKLHLAAGMQTLALADGLAPGPHTVDIVHRSETWHGLSTFHRFATDGTWLAPPALPARKLLVLGDSVTCGEALDRVPGQTKGPSWWDARASYGMLLAQQLGAQVQLVCAGGRGLVRSWDNRTDELNLPDFYQLAIADKAQPEKWNQRDYRPDLILSAIGTNDFNPGIPERAAYVDTYVRFVRTLLRDHPQAQVVLTEGALLSGAKKAALVDYLAETARRVADPRVHIIASHTYPGDAQDGHPTRAQAAQMAHELLPPLRAIAGW